MSVAGADYAVPNALDGERLDRSVALLTGLSRSAVDGMIAGGEVLVDGVEVPSRSRRVRAGETITVTGSVLDVEDATPAGDPSVPVNVVWSDEEVIVVDKPAGMVVHPGAGHARGTLVNGLLAAFPEVAGVGGMEEGRPGIVHRLDKGTSGLLVVARTPGARASLVSQLKERAVHREYLTLVLGTVEADAGVIDAPLARSERHATLMEVRAGGRAARTHYRVESRRTVPVPVTLLRCELETGRTHQIRVHLSSIGHPVVGDRRYGWKAVGDWRPLPADRPFLHAAELGFDHPASGERMRFRSELPADLAAVLADLA